MKHNSTNIARTDVSQIMDSTENKMPGTVQITPGEKSLDEGIVFVKPYAP